MQPDKTKARTYFPLGIVVSVSVHAFFIGLMLVSCLSEEKPEPMVLNEITMAGDWEAIPVTPVTAPDPPEPARPDPPKPEPPKPEPPKPEPPKPEPAKPEPPKPEPAKPESVPAKVEAPKPKEAVKPPQQKKKTKEQDVQNRLDNAPKSKIDPKPPKPSKPNNTQSQDVAKRLKDFADKPSPIPAGRFGNPNGLVGAQLSAYDQYRIQFLEPILQMLWNQLGPDHLNTAPQPVQITLIISKSGNVTTGYVSAPSDNGSMNDGAKKLLEKMQHRKLEPFSAAKLTAKDTLTFVINLGYRQGTR